MVILLGLLVVVVLVVMGAIGIGIGPLVLRDPTRPQRANGTGLPLLAATIGGGVVLLLLTVGVGVVGRGRGAEEGTPTTSRTPATVQRSSTTTTIEVVSTSTSTTTTTVAAAESAPRANGRAALGPVVRVQARDEDQDGEIDQAIGELEPGTVLRMRVEGFHPYTTAHASQCADVQCGNVIDVQFGPEGIATFQYLVVDDFIGASGGCRLDAGPCSIVIENVDGDGRAEIGTLFHDALPDPGEVRVTPRKGLVTGDALTVDVAGFRAGTQLTVVGCVIGTTRCGKAGGTPTFTVASDGSGATQVRAPSCPGRFDCELRVRAERAFSRSAAVGLAFAPVPGADYDSGRVAAGLAVAALLLGAALYLIRRTDWSAVGEEAAPEIDDAEYADLDALVALMPPEDDDVLARY